MYMLGKTLEILGMLVAVLALMFGFEGSMSREFGYLFLAGVIFYAGWLIEKKATQ